MYIFDFIGSDCILNGYVKKLGGPFASAWQTRYAKLYPNRLELHPESTGTRPDLVFLDQVMLQIVFPISCNNFIFSLVLIYYFYNFLFCSSYFRKRDKTTRHVTQK